METKLWQQQAAGNNVVEQQEVITDNVSKGQSFHIDLTESADEDNNEEVNIAESELEESILNKQQKRRLEQSPLERRIEDILGHNDFDQSILFRESEPVGMSENDDSDNHNSNRDENDITTDNRNYSCSTLSFGDNNNHNRSENDVQEAVVPFPPQTSEDDQIKQILMEESGSDNKPS